ncbi:hypothetical protein FKM82_023430 [Ascaphus truei]
MARRKQKPAHVHTAMVTFRGLNRKPITFKTTLVAMWHCPFKTRWRSLRKAAPNAQGLVVRGVSGTGLLGNSAPRSGEKVPLPSAGEYFPSVAVIE